ncbi:hypothetical protein BJX68DRAFT_264970 [Aspergillus pseudodeflectus]|uniref:FAD/NAD(P)-binding domain-containing protein n=1 Tax=Aspergillus pseudodeflectus TaxID=176178 RepID=A0ABR4KN78_9EURO
MSLNQRTPSMLDASPTYTIREEPIGTRRAIRIACMGAGYSGLMMAIVFNEKLKGRNAEFIIYERNEDLGGTWLENRYPGCKCDIPAHNYAYSFAPNPAWPNYYATSEQIHAYMHNVADKYECKQYIRFRHTIRSAVWEEDKGKWVLEVENSEGRLRDEVDVFVNAGGVLNNWKWPNIPGVNTFQGKLIHSARWDQEYDFTGKNVAVIGIGSSGIQIVPELAKVAGSLDIYARSSTWISPAPGINEPTENDPEMDDEYNFTEKTLEIFRDPHVLREYRAAIMDRRSSNFKRAIADSELQHRAQELFRKTMTERLGDSDKGRKIAQRLIPDFPVGCRRLTPGPGFLEALTQDHVTIHWDAIARVNEKGIVTKPSDNMPLNLKEYDVIVCATGFDTSFRPSFPVIGRNGTNLAEKWSEPHAPKAYFSFSVPGMPNYFTFIGPNAVISNGSLVLGIQATAVYIYRWLHKMQTENLHSFEVRQDVTDEYNEHMQTYLSQTVWTRNCRSWYKRGTIDGPVVAIYGGTTFHFIEAVKEPRWEDFRIKYADKGNRFRYLGNGFTKSEERGGSIGRTQTLDFDEFWGLFVLPEIHE